MSEQSRLPFGLNRTRLFIIAMGVVIALITFSMMLGGLDSYQALKDASRAGVEPAAEQVSGE